MNIFTAFSMSFIQHSRFSDCKVECRWRNGKIIRVYDDQLAQERVPVKCSTDFRVMK